MRTRILIASALLLLAACSKSPESEIVPSGDGNAAAGDVGPFTVAFQGPEQTYEHSIKGVPKQNEGKVEYFVTTAEKSKVTLVKTQVQVTGCPAAQVTHHTFWVSDVSNMSEGQLILPGQSFEPKVSVKGVLLHVLKGLDGCSEIEVLTSLKRTAMTQPNPGFPVGGACEGTTDGCMVQVYCREPDIQTNFIEVEIWKRSWGTLVQKYMNPGDGTKRGLMVSETVTPSSTASSLTFLGSSTKLNFSTTTGVGVFTEKFAGQTFQYDLDCAWQ